MTQFRSPSARRTWFHVAVLGLAVSAVGLVNSAAQALDAGTPPTNGLSGLILSPASGDSGTTFAMAFDPPNEACPGNNNDGFFWSTFITPIAQDPALLTFSPAGQPTATAEGRTTSFRDTADEFVRAEFPDLDTSAVIPPSFLSFETTFSRNPVVDPGSYYVGIACSNVTGRINEKYWATTITITAADGAGPHGFTWAAVIDDAATTTTTTIVDETTSTTSTTIVGGTTTTTSVSGGTTTTTLAGASTNATVTPSSPSPGGAYSVGFPDCAVGETITFQQPESTPASVTDVCEASSALTSGGVAGLRMPAQATTGTATGSFTAAPTAPGSYTVTMTGTTSAQRSTTFVIVGQSTPVTGGNTNFNTGGSPTGTNTGTIPSTGSSTTSLIVWAVLLLVFGRMAILLGRKPKVITGT